MEFSILTSCLVAAIAFVSLAAPFFSPPSGELPFAQEDVEMAFGPNRVRAIVGAVVLLTIGAVVVYTAYLQQIAQQYFWFGLFITTLGLVVMVPESRVRRLLIRLLEYLLVLLAVALLIGGLRNFWIAGIEGRALFGRPSGWVSIEKSSGAYWLSVVFTGVLVWLIVHGLREYFYKLFARQKAGSPASRSFSKRDKPRE